MFLSGSSPKMSPAYTPVDSRPLVDPLFTVANVAKTFSSTVPASNYAPPVNEDIPEIVVSAKRVPWWAWALAGGVAFVALNKVLGGR